MAREATIVSFNDAKLKSRGSFARSSSTRSESARSSSARSESARSSSNRSESARFASKPSSSARSEQVRSERVRPESMRSEQARSSSEHSDSARSSSKRSGRRRERTKVRADKMFAKQFEKKAPSDASAEGAPRPALYKAKMGASHRKSARMQRSSSADSPSAKLNVSGWFSTIPLTPRSLKVGTAVLCVFLLCAFLYVPAQQYYQAQREHDRLTAEYSTIEDRNDALDVQNDILASDAGMEDAVRQKYGYVKSGEQVAAVSGLSDHATDTSRDSENIEASVLANSVKAPEEWYTPFLDAFFGVK